MTESQVMKEVLNKLDNLKMTGEILWSARLNSGKVKIGTTWIQLCLAGTPDIVAVVKCKNHKIAVLFIKCKRTGLTKLRYEQQQFFNEMIDKPMIFCIVVNDPNQIYSTIHMIERL